MDDENKPVKFEDGIYYCKNNLCHREDGPALLRNDGTKAWFINGELHREDGPALIYLNGAKSWYINGNLHREDGPVEEYANGSTVWYKNGELHREDGPAVEHADGTKEWWINYNNITYDVEEWMSSNNIPDYKEWTNKEIALFKLKFL